MLAVKNARSYRIFINCHGGTIWRVLHTSPYGSSCVGFAMRDYYYSAHSRQPRSGWMFKMMINKMHNSMLFECNQQCLFCSFLSRSKRLKIMQCLRQFAYDQNLSDAPPENGTTPTDSYDCFSCLVYPFPPCDAAAAAHTTCLCNIAYTLRRPLQFEYCLNRQNRGK